MLGKRERNNAQGAAEESRGSVPASRLRLMVPRCPCPELDPDEDFNDKEKYQLIVIANGHSDFNQDTVDNKRMPDGKTQTTILAANPGIFCFNDTYDDLKNLFVAYGDPVRFTYGKGYFGEPFSELLKGVNMEIKNHGKKQPDPYRVINPEHISSTATNQTVDNVRVFESCSGCISRNKHFFKNREYHFFESDDQCNPTKGSGNVSVYYKDKDGVSKVDLYTDEIDRMVGGGFKRTKEQIIHDVIQQFEFHHMAYIDLGCSNFCGLTEPQQAKLKSQSIVFGGKSKRTKKVKVKVRRSRKHLSRRLKPLSRRLKPLSRRLKN